MSAFENLITVADERELRYLAQRLGEVQIEDPARRDSAIARNAPRVLINSAEITTISAGTKVWGGPSHFNILNFLGGITGKINTYNRNQADIQVGSGLVNVDYVVDSNGLGDYTKLHGAGGALLAAIATGVSKTIWICTTHTETQTAGDVVTLAANQVITILSAGGHRALASSRPTITIGHTGRVLTFSSASQTTSKIVMKGYHYYRTTVNAGHFADATAGIQIPSLTCEEMIFDGDTSLGTWGHWLDTRTGVGVSSCTIGDIDWRDVTYLGLSNSVSATDVSSIVATESHGTDAAARHFNIIDSDITVTNLVFHGSGVTDVAPGAQQAILGNQITIVQTAAADTGYGLVDGFTGGPNQRGFVCNGNTIIFKSAKAFLRIGVSLKAQDIEVSGNYFNANLGGGTNATNFANVRCDFDGPATDISITANVLIGPGGTSTAINVESFFGATATLSQFGINAFRNWGTTVGGTGAMTTIAGPVSFPDSEYFLLAGRAGGQIGYGGTAAGEDLNLRSTFNATKGQIFFGGLQTSLYDENVDRWAIGVNQTAGNTVSGSTATNRITVHQSTNDFGLSMEQHAAGASTAGQIGFFRSRGTAGAETIVQSGDYLGRLTFYGHDGTDYEPGASIDVVVDGTPASGGDTTDMPGRIMFSTTPDGSNVAVERMRLTNDGAMWVKGVAAPATPSSDYTAIYNETGTDLLKAKDDNGAVYNLTIKHLIVVHVDGTVTNQYTLVGPMPQAGTITASKSKTDDRITVGATSWTGEVYKIPAANIDTEGGGEAGSPTIYSTPPAITNGHMVSTNDVLSVTTFAAGDYFSFRTTQVGTNATFVEMSLTVRYT